MYRSQVSVRILKNGTWPFYRATIKNVVVEVIHKTRMISDEEVLHALRVNGYTDIKDNQIASIRPLTVPMRIANNTKLTKNKR